MVTPEVTGVWEFYRDNCPGFKEPMRKQLRKVDSHMAELESQNAKLRELVADMYACIGALCSMVENSPGCSMCPTNQDEERPCAAADVYCRMRELGVSGHGVRP